MNNILDLIFFITLPIFTIIGLVILVPRLQKEILPLVSKYSDGQNSANLYAVMLAMHAVDLPLLAIFLALKLFLK